MASRGLPNLPGYSFPDPTVRHPRGLFPAARDRERARGREECGNCRSGMGLALLSVSLYVCLSLCVSMRLSLRAASPGKDGGGYGASARGEERGRAVLPGKVEVGGLTRRARARDRGTLRAEEGGGRSMQPQTRRRRCAIVAAVGIAAGGRPVGESDRKRARDRERERERERATTRAR